MHIEHIAIWVKDLEVARSFYEKYFGATSNKKYINETKGFSSYFLSFASGARIEIMHNSRIPDSGDLPIHEATGYSHFAFSTGSKEEVDRLTNLLRADGYTVLGGPRTTGDGYYESAVLDFEGNRIELTV